MNNNKRMQPLFTATLMVAGALALAGTLNAASRSTSYTYYNTAPKQGLLQSIDGPRTDVADITTLDYDNQGNLTLVTNALGHSSQILAHDPSGRPLEAINSNGLHTTFQYDVRGRLTQTTRFPDGDSPANGRTTAYTYTPAGDISRIALPSGDTLDYIYDDARRLTQVSDSQGQSIVYTLDLMGNILSETVYASDSSLVRQQSAVYNQLGQLFQTIGAQNQTTEYGYDLNGNNNSLLDARSNPTSQAFDALNRLKTVLDAKAGSTDYGYDAAGHLNTVTDPNGSTTTYTYDGLGNLKTLNSPDTGLTTYDTYDDAGNRLQETHANGITISYTYDALNRLTQIHYPDSSQDIRYHYDGSNYTADDQPPASHAPIGQRTGMSDSTGNISWFYNAQGELIQTSQTLLAGGSPFITRHNYQATTGLLASTTYPSGRRLDYYYDAQGQITQIDLTENAQTQTLISNVQYQPFGGVKSLDYGNGLSLSRSFDLDGRLTSQSVTGTGTILDLTWDYDPVSSVKSINNLLDAALSQSFNYDALDRLSSAQTDASLYGLLGFAYDANGNRTQQDDNSLITDYLISNTGNRTDSANGAQNQTFQYDAKGNIIQRTRNGDTFDYHYNQQNRLSQIDKNGTLLVTYLYNGLGQRVSKILADGTLTDYLYSADGQLMSEVDTSGDIIRDYLYFAGEPLALIHLSTGQQASTVDTVFDNTSATVSYTGTWLSSTYIAGYEGDNYQYHGPQSLSHLATIIDNGSAGFSVTGEWLYSTAVAGYEGSNYQHHYANGASPDGQVYDNSTGIAVGDWPVSTNVAGYEASNYQYHSAGQGNNTFTWHTASSVGQYKVYAHWTANSGRASNATYTVHHANGSTDVTVNQKKNGGQWTLLGTFDLDNNSRVVLSDLADGYVIADAIIVASPDAPPNTATWTLNASGEQQVYARWTANSIRASNATYTVHHANGSTDVTVNQKKNGAQWHLLGTFTLDANSQVTLTDQADGYVIADAVAVQTPGATGNAALWSSLVSAQGNYDVYAKWTASASRASNAIYTVTHAGGASDITVNQQTSGGQWVLLGNYTLNSDSTISLSGDGNGYVIADAIRITGDATVGNTQNKVYYYHNDHLGTPQVITDQNQQVVWQANYKPFGEANITTEQITNNLRFSGQYFDAESGLHYNYFRYMDPTLGRYITSDPIGLNGGLNTYAYVENNPLNGIDPFGLARCRNTLDCKIQDAILRGDIDTLQHLLDLDGGILYPNPKKIVQQCRNYIKGAAKSKQPKLKRIHSDDTMNSGSNRYDLESQRQRSTEDIIESLRPGSSEPLRVKPDGRIMDGNTRIKVLEERGIDVNSLPRTMTD